MNDTTKSPIGKITWTDLTVPDAEPIRNFYSQVVGWSHEAVDMGGYADFNMNIPENGETVAGICHARGENSQLPPQWLVYITVENLDMSLTSCKQMAGKILAPRKEMGKYGSYAVIQDPAGAVCALFEPAK